MSIMEWINKVLKPISPPSAKDSPLELIDLFDPFTEYDISIVPKLRWINKPDFILTLPPIPRVPQAYRITVDTSGFDPETFMTSIKESNQIVLTGRESKEKKEPNREFNKNYILPTQAESDKLVTFMKNDKLLMEMPLKKLMPDVELFPSIYSNSDGTKTVQMHFTIPDNFDASKVDVSLIDQDLVVRAEDIINKPDDISKFHYYQRTKLPENTAFKELKCAQINNTISCSAPLLEDFKKNFRKIPIEVIEKPTVNLSTAQTSSKSSEVSLEQPQPQKKQIFKYF